jgi:hypothetical protein
MPEFTQTISNEPNLLLIVLYGCGFLIAVVWNLYAYYKLFRLDHTKRELTIKHQFQVQSREDQSSV